MGFSGVLALLISCAALCAQTASLGGIAVNSVTGQPLSGVHLKLVTVNVGGVVENAFGALSGRDGRFSVTGVPPGTYLLLTERTGFVHMMTVTGAVPLPSITFKAGERMADYRLELTPRAVIAVRVSDEYGDPVPNATLEATLVTTGDPLAAGTNMGRRVSTNLMGEGRITSVSRSCHRPSTA